MIEINQMRTFALDQGKVYAVEVHSIHLWIYS